MAFIGGTSANFSTWCCLPLSNVAANLNSIAITPLSSKYLAAAWSVTLQALQKCVSGYWGNNTKGG